jgi:mono/diheme cytochrome c family protein
VRTSLHVRRSAAVLGLAAIGAFALASRALAVSDRASIGPVIVDRTTWDSVYTEAQAVRGQAFYAATCQACHLASLSGADQVPALAGGAFVGKWDGLTLGSLHDRVRRTMPPSAPGSYARKDITDVIAYLLRENEFPAGKRELSGEADSLAAIRITASRAP